MRKYIPLFLMTLLFCVTADAEVYGGYEDDCCCVDEADFYAKILGGVNFLQNTTIDQNRATYQAGYLVAASLGYRWCYGLRLEAEYAFRRNGIQKIDFYVEGFSKHGHYESSSVMGNVLWDLPLASWGCSCWNIQPFVGGGVGYDFQRMHATNSRVIFNQKWNHFAWQLMAGFSYPVFCHAKMTLEYTFHQGGSHFNNHSIGVGLIYEFAFPKLNVF